MTPSDELTAAIEDLERRPLFESSDAAPSESPRWGLMALVFIGVFSLLQLNAISAHTRAEAQDIDDLIVIEGGS